MTDQRDDIQQQDDNRDGETTGGVRQRAIEAYDSARDGIGSAGRKGADALDEAPLIALAGGIAAGALLAALLPRSRKEEELLRPVGQRLTGSAKAAAEAAKQAGTQRLQELGLTRERGMETLKSVLRGAEDAAKSSAQAAMGTVRKTD